jgi:hypothetical protein
MKMNAQFARAHISKRDFEEAQDYLRAYRDEYPDSVKRALLVAATVSYARPFTENHPGDGIQSTPRLAVRLTKLLTSDEASLHEKLLDIRHKAVAHSAYARKPARLISGIGSGFLVQSKPCDILGEPIDIQLFLVLSTKLANHCLDSMHALNKQLRLGAGKSKGSD